MAIKDWNGFKKSGDTYIPNDATARAGVTATVDLLKDTTGWLGGNLNGCKYADISEANYAFTANDDGTVTGEIKNVTASTQTSNCSPFTAPFSAQVMLSGGVSGEATIYPWDVTTDTRPYTDSTKTTRQTADDIGSGVSFWMEEGHQYKLRPRFMANASIQTVVFKPMLLTMEQYALNPSYRPSHESVEDYIWDINAKTGVHNFVLGGLSGYSLGAQGNIYADATYDLHFGIVKQGESYTVTTDDSAGFVGGYFTSMPTPSSVTYNSSRVVSANKTFTAPIDGYVVFRTTHNYATSMFCLADDLYDGYTKGAMTNTQLTEKVTAINAELNKNIITDNSNNTTFNIPLVRKSDGYTYGEIIGANFLYHFFINTPSAQNAVTFNKVYDGNADRVFSGSYANGVFTITSSATIYGGIMVITSNV